MTGIPGIYGDDLSEPAKVAYARWMMSLFKLCEHIDTCPFDCEDEDVACLEGRPYRDVEQERLREWRAVRDAEVTP
jgi:hypothetical protein